MILGNMHKCPPILLQALQFRERSHNWKPPRRIQGPTQLNVLDTPCRDELDFPGTVTSSVVHPPVNVIWRVRPFGLGITRSRGLINKIIGSAGVDLIRLTTDSDFINEYPRLA